MSMPVSFSGTRSITDKTTGETVTVKVWGQFVGSGVDAHEVAPMQQWIEQGLFDVLAQYGGPLATLPSIAQQWGATVSGQLAQAFAQQFQAQGQIHVQGVEVVPGGAMGGGFAGSSPMMSKQGGGGDVQQRVAMALQSQMGLQPAQAQQAAMIAINELQAAGVAVQAGAGAAQGYGQKGYDQGYGQKGYDQGAQKGYDQGAQKGYDQSAQYGQKQGGYEQKGYDPNAGAYDQKQGGYDQGAQKGYDPNAGAYDPKGGYGGYDQGGKDPYKKG